MVINNNFSSGFQSEPFSIPPETPVNSILHPSLASDTDRVEELISAGALWGVNAQSHSGSPLFRAVKANNIELVKHLLKYGAWGSINKTNTYTRETPLQAAIQLENYEMAKLLLENGASASINNENYLKSTALHTALTSSNVTLVHLLLQNGAAPSLDVQNNIGLTLFHQLMTTGDHHKVKMLLDLAPEVAEKINTPDDFGVTPFQRAARAGNIQLVRMLAAVVQGNILTNDKAHFIAEDLRACTTTSEIEALKLIPLRKFAFPLTIAQNNCQVMIRMKDGRVLKLSNTDAVEARTYLMKAKYGTEWDDDSGHNVLTTYLSPGHGFLRLKCRNCNSNSKQFNQSIGFYPSGTFTKEALQTFLPKFIKRLGHTAEVSLSAIKTLPLPQSSTDSIVQLILEAKKNFQQNLEPSLELVLEQYGSIQEELWYENDSTTRNSLKVQFFLTDSQSQEAFKRIMQVSSSCRGTTKEACIYRFSSANCVDFVHSVFSASGANGQIMDYVTDAQAGFGHLLSPEQLYQFKAMDYAYIQSRGLTGYALATAGLLPDQFANAEELAGEDDLNTLAVPPPLNTPTLNLHQMVATAALGLVLSKELGNLARSIKTIWIKNTGERTSLEEATEFSALALAGLKKISNQLFDLDCTLFTLRQQHLGDHVTSLKIGHLQKKQIDLEFDLYDLKDDLQKIMRLRPLPTKKYLNLCHKNFTELERGCAQLSDAIKNLYIESMGPKQSLRVELKGKLAKPRTENIEGKNQKHPFQKKKFISPKVSRMHNPRP
jgi:ankyrin repeat protein